jgi:hypothetical protein
MGHPHTEQLHTIERYTRTDLGNMSIEVTIDDPGTYTKPFTTVGRARIMAGTELLEYICQENNSDITHISGLALGPGGGGRSECYTGMASRSNSMVESQPSKLLVASSILVSRSIASSLF